MTEKKKPMDCFEFCEIYLDLDRPETRGAELCDEALGHAELCSACAARLMESESLDFSLRKVAESVELAEAPSRVEAALLAEFRRAHPVVAPRRADKVKWDTAWFAIAAMVVLAFGLTIYKRHVPIRTAPNALSLPADLRATSSSATPSAVQPVASTSAENANAQAAANDSANSDAGSAEYASEFVPLPYSDGLSDGDSGTVVRVDLPRSSLASMGIPVSGLAAGDRVVADLVVSEDGTPQAIRLVSEAN